MLTSIQTEAIQKHLQGALEQSVADELKYILEEDVIADLPEDISLDDILVEVSVSVSCVRE
jgi:hypothetical protein